MVPIEEFHIFTIHYEPPKRALYKGQHFNMSCPKVSFIWRFHCTCISIAVPSSRVQNISSPSVALLWPIELKAYTATLYWLYGRRMITNCVTVAFVVILEIWSTNVQSCLPWCVTSIVYPRICRPPMSLGFSQLIDTLLEVMVLNWRFSGGLGCDGGSEREEKGREKGRERKGERERERERERESVTIKVSEMMSC